LVCVAEKGLTGRVHAVGMVPAVLGIQADIRYIRVGIPCGADLASHDTLRHAATL
jgi:hypothetical protein